MLLIWTNFIIEVINLGATILATIIMRWLLSLSTPEKDLAWLKKQSWYKQLARMRFYRGQELMYQIRAFHVYSSSAS
jgi:hypothetical protein